MRLPARTMEMTATVTIILLVSFALQRIVAVNESLSMTSSSDGHLPLRPGSPVLSRQSLERIAGAAAAGAPFRLASKLADIRFGEIRPTEIIGPVERPHVLPQFEVRAIIGGPPWRGIVRGLPDAPGDVVVRIGDHFPPFTIQAINGGGVTITGPDSTLHVRLQRMSP